MRIQICYLYCFQYPPWWQSVHTFQLQQHSQWTHRDLIIYDQARSNYKVFNPQDRPYQMLKCISLISKVISKVTVPDPITLCHVFWMCKMACISILLTSCIQKLYHRSSVCRSHGRVFPESPVPHYTWSTDSHSQWILVFRTSLSI